MMVMQNPLVDKRIDWYAGFDCFQDFELSD
jgi:hypothetical protein